MKTDKDIIIIGAGIAGLSAGIFARQSGFDVTIYESHSIAGGNSTGWKRGGYYCEGGMHWLVGSKEQTPLNKLWHEVGALQENNPIHNRDPFLTYINDKERIALYRDIDKLKKGFLAVSPQDKKAIERLAKDIKAMKNMTIPVTDIKGVKVRNKYSMSLSQLLGYIKTGQTIARTSKMTIDEYVAAFQHEGIRSLIGSVIPMGSYSAMAMLTTLGGLAAYDSGYPKGGSLQMAQNVTNTFKKLGGIIEYGKRVEKINVTTQKADGVWIDGSLHKADAVIVTADALTAMDKLFEQPLHEPWMDELRHEATPVNCEFISFGVAADLSHLPENIILPLKGPVSHDGKQFKSVAFNNYASFDGYAPRGCTAVTCVLSGEDTYDKWKRAKEDGIYQEKKQALAKFMIKLLEQNIPETVGKVEVWDIATPLTYERYCGMYRGSWMSTMTPKQKRVIFPCCSKNISSLYFAGQRFMLPGGVPAALLTARTAMQQLCKDTNTVFQGNM